MGYRASLDGHCIEVVPGNLGEIALRYSGSSSEDAQQFFSDLHLPSSYPRDASVAIKALYLLRQDVFASEQAVAEVIVSFDDAEGLAKLVVDYCGFQLSSWR